MSKCKSSSSKRKVERKTDARVVGKKRTQLENKHNTKEKKHNDGKNGRSISAFTDITFTNQFTQEWIEQREKKHIDESCDL